METYMITENHSAIHYGLFKNRHRETPNGDFFVYLIEPILRIYD